MNLLAILSNIRLPDMVDILLISIVVYQFYSWFWGTQAFKVLVGLAILSGIFVVAKSWGLFLTTWVFQILWPVFVILLIILFQKEIRQMLEHFNPLKMMGSRHGASANGWISGFAEWIFDAARKRTGVLVVFQTQSLVDDFITRGVDMESDPQPEILTAVFDKHSPLHDGAMLISNGKVASVSCFLPLSTRDDLPRQWGTRHRAALGLTEKCDAGALIVSEERGSVSLVHGGEVREIPDAATLAGEIENMTRDPRETHRDVKTVLRGWITRRYKAKAVVFCMVVVLWLAFAGQQNFEKTITLPLTVKNLPPGVVLATPEIPGIQVTYRGLRKDVSLLGPANTAAVLNLAGAAPGKLRYSISTANLILPNNRIQIANINPPKIDLVLERKK
ncbi:MAG: diadenylate cyclase [Desulfobacter sp.]